MFKIKNFFFLKMIFFLSFLSCNKVENNFQKDIINREKIVKIIVDIHIADAAISVNSVYKRKKIEEIKSYYSSIFEKHNITKKEFETSIAYYTENTDIYEKICEEVIIVLTKMEKKI